MNRRALLLLLPALLLLTGGTWQLHRAVARQAIDAEAAAARADRLEKETAVLQRAYEATQRDLDAASRQLAELPPPEPGERARELEVRAWLARVKQLRRLFKQRPNQAIPEMALLDDGDWLLAARKIDLNSEDDVRKALAAIRNAADAKFTRQIAPAVDKYRRAFPNTKPDTVMALVPYFDNPPDLTMLQRFEITTVARPQPVPIGRPNPPGWMIWEATAIDPDYDIRSGVQSTGGIMGLDAPAAWIPNFRDRLIAAQQKYVAANYGVAATNLTAVLPLFDPPLEPATIEKLLKAERERRK